ncbi:hypothetical protein [Paenibacillus harenae]|uniref:Uncharacterized protein n=1 Tax=Paenibacillus harenae TaxID=306543 RepID=A0ABT9U3D3_PAEHA|nr:hypothetical protein [Paenibacillus harenae]MDQ0058614.1 hypothetical protein [Paenibacillus harenae]MDQ0114063.1 hypothetical protein [Paenibacillus harenae]
MGEGRGGVVLEDIRNLNDFLAVFGLPIAMSLIGGLIGHFVKNGIVELPKFVIEYDEEGANFSGSKLIRWVQRPIRFLFFMIGYRNGGGAKKNIFFDLGFFGDLLIAIGTGIVAKCTLAMANTDNIYAVVSSSLLAGYAGLSYLKAKQSKEIADTVIEQLEVDNKGKEEGARGESDS